MPGQVHIVDDDGSVSLIAAKDLPQAEKEGARLATKQDIKHAQNQAEYGGALGHAGAFGLGAASTLTLGLSDQAGRGLGYGKEIEGLSSANPNARMAGEVAGIAAPIAVDIATGGAATPLVAESAAGLAGRLATGVPRAIGTVGRGLESAVGGIAGESMLGRAAAKGAGFAAEGALYGVGHEISDAAIENHDLTAQKLWAAGQQGALFGGALGAGGSIAGSLLSKGALSVASKIAEGSGKTLAEYIEQKGGEAFGRSLGVNKRVVGTAERWAEGGYEGVTKRAMKELPELAGVKSVGEVTAENAEIGVLKGLERDGGRIEGAIRKLDEAAAGSQPKAISVVQDIENVTKELSEHYGTQPVVSKLQGLIDDFKIKTGLVDMASGKMVADADAVRVPFQHLKQLSTDIRQNFVNYGPLELKSAQKQLNGIRSLLEGRIETAMEEHGGKALANEYKDAKAGYQTWKYIQKALENKASRDTSNMLFGLTDKIGAGAGATVGSIIGGAPGAMIGTMVGGALNKAFRAKGDILIADTLSKLSQLESIQRLSAHVDARIADGAASFIKPGKATMAVKGPKFDKAESMVTARNILETSSNPDLMQTRIKAAIGNIDAHSAPNIVQKLAETASMGVTYLSSHAPALRANERSLTPFREHVRASDSDVSKFAQRVEGVANPLSVLTDMKSGRLSREKVEAVQAVYPDLYQQIKEEVLQQAAEQGKSLDYGKRVQISTLFGGGVADDTLTPEFIKAIQNAKAEDAPDAQQEQGPPQVGSKRPIDMNTKIFATEGDRLEGTT